MSLTRERLQRALPAVIGLALFFIALEVLRRELHAVTWHSLSADAMNTPPLRLLSALLLTMMNYTVLTGYDFIALSYIGKKIPRLRVALTSFIAYAIAHNVGLGVLSGTSVRYRFFTRFGITAEDLSRIVFSNGVAFGLGMLALGGGSLAFAPSPPASALIAPVFIKPLGWLLMAICASYLILAAVRRAPFRIRSIELRLPRLRLAFIQLANSCADWLLAASVFYVLLPRGASFWVVMGAYIGAQILGLASHVPGGVGVFEGLMILFLNPYFTTAELVSTLVVFRAVFYFVPLSLALVFLIGDEIHRRRAHAARVTAYLGQLTERLAPKALAIFTFLGGIVLLFSGATPVDPHRLAFLHRVLPLAII